MSGVTSHRGMGSIFEIRAGGSLKAEVVFSPCPRIQRGSTLDSVQFPPLPVQNLLKFDHLLLPQLSQLPDQHHVSGVEDYP